MDQEAIDAAIVARLPQLVPVPDSISWRQVAAADRAAGEWEIQQIQQERAPYDLFRFAATSWANLVRGFIERRADK